MEIDRDIGRGGWGLRVFDFELWLEEYAQPISIELGLRVGYQIDKLSLIGSKERLLDHSGRGSAPSSAYWNIQLHNSRYTYAPLTSQPCTRVAASSAEG